MWDITFYMNIICLGTYPDRDGKQFIIVKAFHVIDQESTRKIFCNLFYPPGTGV